MFIKISKDIVLSSIRKEAVKNQLIWVYLLTQADWEGFIHLTTYQLSRALGFEEIEIKEAIEAFMKPDPDSTTKEEDGRRLIPSGDTHGWQVVNFKKYRGLGEGGKSKRSQYSKEWIAAKRAEDPTYGRKPKKSGRLVDSGVDRLPHIDVDKDLDKSNHPPKVPSEDSVADDAVKTSPPVQEKGTSPSARPAKPVPVKEGSEATSPVTDSADLQKILRTAAKDPKKAKDQAYAILKQKQTSRADLWKESATLRGLNLWEASDKLVNDPDSREAKILRMVLAEPDIKPKKPLTTAAKEEPANDSHVSEYFKKGAKIL